MGSGILGIGVSGLSAAQAGILVTGHNISNVTTPSYNRQQTVQTTNTSLPSGSGFFGQGVQVTTVQRLYSDFLTTQVNQAQAQGSQLSTYSTQINQIDNLLGNATVGLSPALQNFFSSVQGVSNTPSSVPSRQSMLS
ncbi:MAG: flagellar hook-associated protein FlgK, partial [Burkholderiales bacterium]|nr:flagellar hook-associated protein FlgK [Burkholderiales bacterium]